MTTLTETVQNRLEHYLSHGDYVIDATAGNGFDTVFLAKQVGNAGKVFAFDIQQIAIEKTRQRLLENNLLEPVQLIHNTHSHMSIDVPSNYHQKISCVMFNLGYLPGSDKSCITQPNTTLEALRQSLALLKQGGLLSIMLYPGHEGGKQESVAVLKWLSELPEIASIEHEVTPGPQWHRIIKQ